MIQPWSEAREAWNNLASSDVGATLYHDERWLRLLSRTYGFELTVASVVDGSKPAAACVLASIKNPFHSRLCALPFSDSCPPLATDRSALGTLFEGLISQPRVCGGYEIRGVELPPPWQVANCFNKWKVDLDGSPGAIERRMARHFRRQVGRAAKAALSVRCGSSLDDLHGFYRLMLESRRRQGVPVQSLRFFRLTRELFSPDGDIEIWSVSKTGQIIASLLLLRSFGSLHYKWGARCLDGQAGATHLLFRSVIEQHAGAVRWLDLGRTDIRNSGLVRFKQELGAEADPLPYSFCPKGPKHVSPEVLSRFTWVLSQAWRRLPLSATRALSSVLYRYMA